MQGGVSSAPPKTLERGAVRLWAPRGPALWAVRGQGRTQGARASWHGPWQRLPELQEAAASRQPVPFPPFISVLGSVKCEGVNSLSKQGPGRIRDVSRAVPAAPTGLGPERGVQGWAAWSAYCVPRWAAGKAPAAGSSSPRGGAGRERRQTQSPKQLRFRS